MKVSESWLREWCNPSLALDALGHQLTMAGCEVEGVEPVATAFSGIVVAEVLTVTKHPDADKLNVCTVSYGTDEVLQIVCGAPNVRAGMKAPLALIGAKLPMPDGSTLTIKKGKLRGVESQGMLCSAAEMGMSDKSDGLLDLPADAPVGTPLREYLKLDDQVLELNITPNRGDCLSIAGVAREASLLTSAPLVPPAIPTIAASTQDTFKVTIAATEACPRYAGRVVRGVNAKASTPLWMKEKLRRQGLRSIAPLVDITNYVLIELGQPMHAFDLNQLQGEITVRLAHNGEQITLLDGQSIELKDNTLLITDQAGAVAIAGIMGGQRTAVSLETTDLFLESAHFAPSAIAGRARQYGLQTDASYRYERGVAADLCVQALERATQLVLEICGGQAGPIVDNVAEASALTKRSVTLRAARIKRVLGITLEHAEVKALLERLGCEVTDTAEGWQVLVPLARFDITIEEDLLEEVARVYGYDAIPAVMRPLTPMLHLPSQESVRLEQLRAPLIARGYQEAVTFSFVDEAIEEQLSPGIDRIRLLNPLSAELGLMRSTLWSGLLRAVSYNLNRQQTRVRLFEVGAAFSLEEGQLQQRRKIAGVVTGFNEPEQWAAPKRKVDFFDIKGDVEAILAAVSGETFYFIPVVHAALHPGQCAQIATKEQVVGWVGALHPQLESTLGLDQSVFLFELDLAYLQKARVPHYTAVSKFPALRRDLSLVMDSHVLAQSLERIIANVAPPQVVSWTIFDIYTGQGVELGKKSVALNLIIQDASRTLEDSEVNTIVATVVAALEAETGATLR
ncbi:phenylalanine--tRNA ligase subunit beta [Thiofilum flexile]|uniref:phenylalanine--tRNA ligase subunit beta n=1 Tax=Thiofilum flexile TaxID=125627 RepID=UPI000371C094|nr:phenylalanine--tRNA ligase subunit beta [Thiofilum flexile]